VGRSSFFFDLIALTPDDMDLLEQSHNGSGSYSMTNRNIRFRKHGACCYKQSLLSARNRHSAAASKYSSRISQYADISQVLSEWMIVKDTFQYVLDKGISPLRWHWKEVFTRSCTDTNSTIGCGCCDGCRVRFVQALLVIVSAQGVSDQLVLPYWGALFRHPRFR
jgi:hypothetical protein